MNDQDIYKRQDLLELYKNPPYRGELSNATVEVTERNPACGDVVTLDLLIENDVIKDAKFTGEQCAVSVISSAMLLDEILGKTVDAANAVTKEDLLKLIDLNLTTSRVKCATLVLDALKSALKVYDTKR